MAKIDVSNAATAGLGLMARQPLTVLIWGLLHTAYVAGVLALFAGGAAETITALVRNAPDRRPITTVLGQIATLGAENVTPNQPPIGAMLGLIGALFGVILLLWLGQIVFGTMIQAAVLRAELEPEKRGFAYLRFGGAELWLLGTNITRGLVLFVAQIAMAIPLGILTTALLLATVGVAGLNHHAASASALLAPTMSVRGVGQLIMLGVVLWLWIRLSMGPVMSFRERQFRLFESWALTKGHALPIFLSLLLAWLMLVAFTVLIWIAGGIGMFAAVGATVASFHTPQAFFNQPPKVWLAELAPAGAILAVMSVLGVGLRNALVWGAVARLYRQLSPERGEPEGGALV